MVKTDMLTVICILGKTLTNLLLVQCIAPALSSLVSSLPSPVGLFSVVQFPNEACNSGSGSTGTCYTASECSTKSGTVDGTCAAGFGVCCLGESLTVSQSRVTHSSL